MIRGSNEFGLLKAFYFSMLKKNIQIPQKPFGFHIKSYFHWKVLEMCFLSLLFRWMNEKNKSSLYAEIKRIIFHRYRVKSMWDILTRNPAMYEVKRGGCLIRVFCCYGDSVWNCMMYPYYLFRIHGFVFLILFL